MRSLRLLAMSLLFTATLVLPGAGAASAASGVCKSSSGVTVVVSFGSLGGGTVVRCVTAGGSGLDALRSAGLSTEGTTKDGPGFVCRIQGKPTANSGESCRATPPTKKSWRYFHTSNGGSWTISQSGAGNRNTVNGGFEGWSFGGGSTPNVAPRRSSSSGGSSQGSTGSDGGSNTEDGSGSSSQGGGSGSANGPSSAGGKALPKPKPRSGDSGKATGKSSKTTGGSATPSTKPQSSDAKNAAATSSDGKQWVPWVAAIVIIVLIATAIVTQRRRSSSTEN